MYKFVGSDYFTENFQLKENKTKMRNTCKNKANTVWARIRFGVSFEQGFEFGLDWVRINKKSR